MTEVGSHVQIPRLILKNFHNENNELFYYDVDLKTIKKGHAKTFYREQGYFSDYVEGYLGKTVETPLGKLVSFLKKAEFKDGENPPLNYIDTAFTYLYSLMSRAPMLLNEINENSRFFQLLSEQDQHDIAAHDTLILAKERELLGEYRVAFMINRTSEEMVLPTGGITQYGSRLICPISPWRALVFDKNIRNISDDENINFVTLFEVLSSEEIVMINREAMTQEICRNRKHIVATNRALLELLLKQIENNCEKNIYG